jgi:NAD(P)-dependent dehydrogenase (short-subunit alcohol dehydrogenase family)
MQQTLSQNGKTGHAGLEGKVAVVTGGGRGLGAAICRVLARAGVQVALTDIREDLAEDTVRSIRAAGGECHSVIRDIGDDNQADQAVLQALDKYGKVDILVNNAGVDVTLPVDELSVGDWDKIIRTNLRGPFLMSKYIFPHMKKHGSGHIVNIVSTAAKRAWANASGYHASKWGLLGFSHALHVEGRPFGIKVTAVISGGMRTPFLLDRFPEIDINTLQDPENVAETVRFVLSQPADTVIPEMMVLPMRETSWP